MSTSTGSTVKYPWPLTMTDITMAGMVHASTQGNTNKHMIDKTKDEAINNSGIPLHVPLPCGTLMICKINTHACSVLHVVVYRI